MTVIIPAWSVTSLTCKNTHTNVGKNMTKFMECVKCVREIQYLGGS